MRNRKLGMTFFSLLCWPIILHDTIPLGCRRSRCYSVERQPSLSTTQQSFVEGVGKLIQNMHSLANARIKAKQNFICDRDTHPEVEFHPGDFVLRPHLSPMSARWSCFMTGTKLMYTRMRTMKTAADFEKLLNSPTRIAKIRYTSVQYELLLSKVTAVVQWPRLSGTGEAQADTGRHPVEYRCHHVSGTEGATARGLLGNDTDWGIWRLCL